MQGGGKPNFLLKKKKRGINMKREVMLKLGVATFLITLDFNHIMVCGEK